MGSWIIPNHVLEDNSDLALLEPDQETGLLEIQMSDDSD